MLAKCLFRLWRKGLGVVRETTKCVILRYVVTKFIVRYLISSYFMSMSGIENFQMKDEDLNSNSEIVNL